MARWNPPLRAWAEKSGVRMDTVMRKATMDVFARVVAASPVDTGRFKSNWNVSFGAIDVTVTDSKNTARADAEVRKVAAYPAGSVIYLANALPYAMRLEYGYSKQAASGMVRIAAAEWAAKVRAAIKAGG